MKTRARQQGFTLLEMMVVIALIGLVSAIVAVSVIGVYEPARVSTTREQLVAVKAAAKTFYVLKGHFPERLEQLVAEHVLDDAPRDSWGRPIDYRLVDGAPVLTSRGKDGDLGTEDDLVLK